MSECDVTSKFHLSRATLSLENGWVAQPLDEGYIVEVRRREYFCCFQVKVKVLLAQLPLTLCDPMDCSPPGSSVHGILQDRILEWAAIPFSRQSSRPRDRTQVFRIAGILYHLSHQVSFKVNTDIKSLTLHSWIRNLEKLLSCWEY